MNNARQVMEQGAALLASANGAVTVDMSAVTELDSSAIAMLLEWQRRLAARQSSPAGSAQLKIANPPASLQTLAQLYGVTELLSYT